jgi:epoxyqueuosine reductase
MNNLRQLVIKYAREIGFDLVAITGVEAFEEEEAITLDRMTKGLMDGLPWYTESRVKRGCKPQELLPGARSIISVAINYNIPHTNNLRPIETHGKVARYAWGDDYHKVLKKRLKEYVRGLSQKIGSSIEAKWYVDDGPMLDRAVAQRAGLGWYGKNTNILTPIHGSWVFLGQVITNLDLEPDAPSKKSCGECVRCIDACPTEAIIAPYIIDNTRCISYLTIEHRGPIPFHLRPLMQDWVFGCDICQDVCPVNIKAMYTKEQAFQKRRFSILELVQLLEMTPEVFQETFSNSPIKRTGLAALQRNACVALGNTGSQEVVPTLVRALQDGVPLVRGHAAWALGMIGGALARMALEEASDTESSPEVITELQSALKTVGT